MGGWTGLKRDDSTNFGGRRAGCDDESHETPSRRDADVPSIQDGTERNEALSCVWTMVFVKRVLCP